MAHSTGLLGHGESGPRTQEYMMPPTHPFGEPHSHEDQHLHFTNPLSKGPFAVPSTWSPVLQSLSQPWGWKGPSVGSLTEEAIWNSLQVPLWMRKLRLRKGGILAQVSGTGQGDLRARPLLQVRLRHRHYVNARQCDDDSKDSSTLFPSARALCTGRGITAEWQNGDQLTHKEITTFPSLNSVPFI